MTPRANLTITSYNASVVKIYNATNSIVYFRDKKYFSLVLKWSSLLQRWRCSCKFGSRRIGSRKRIFMPKENPTSESLCGQRSLTAHFDRLKIFGLSKWLLCRLANGKRAGLWQPHKISDWDFWTNEWMSWPARCRIFACDSVSCARRTCEQGVCVITRDQNAGFQTTSFQTWLQRESET
jgi:hypothetical protein